jgi:hypothetical protein
MKNMALNLKSNGKPVAKKAVVGKSKKKTVWWKKVYIGSAVSILVLSIGYTGYNWWNVRQMKAKAAGWSVVARVSNAYLQACKIEYGSFYIVRWLVSNGTPYGVTAYPKLALNTQSNVKQSTSIGAYPYSANYGKTLYVDKSIHAIYDGSISSPSLGSGGGVGPVYTLQTCP